MLYIVGTPLGNLEDTSFRQAKTLLSSDVILSEDTRTLETLLNFCERTFNLKRNPNIKIVSYYKDVEFEKLPQALEYLEQDMNVSLVSEGGMPLISDPGLQLITQVIKNNIPYTAIPGPTAFVNGVVLSGFNTSNILFLGFLPKKENEIKKIIHNMMSIVDINKEICFASYESPQRIQETLHLMSELIPDAQVVVCREMTKKFEEIKRGKPMELEKELFKGEITMIVNIKAAK